MPNSSQSILAVVLLFCVCNLSAHDDKLWADLEIVIGNPVGPENIVEEYRIYININGRPKYWQWNLRLGVTNEDVSEMVYFAGLELEYPVKAAVLGVDIAQTYQPGWGEDNPADDITRAEAYVRLRLADQCELTSSLRWLYNGELNALEEDSGHSIWAGAIQLDWNF